MDSLLLGIDIGTSACKAALFKKDGTLVATATASYPTHYPNPGWVEQRPDDWWDAVCKALNKLWETADPKSVVGVAVDGQSWAAIAVDAQGQVLCPTPIWMDTRADELCSMWDEDIIFSISGNPFRPSYTLPKILWYKKHLPDVYKKTAHILQCNSFIAYRLTDVISQDLSQSNGLHCFDLQKGAYDFILCNEMGIKSNIFPEISECHQIIGKITSEASKACGLIEGTPVVAGGLDAACGALGAGVLHNGQTQLQGGQAGGMGICTSEYKPHPSLIMSYHVVPGHWLLQGGTVGGGGVLRWFREQFDKDESFDQLTAQAEAIHPGSDGLIFLPYMAGERSPIWDKDAKGILYGLDYSKTKAHTIRAVLEGVAFSIKHNLEVAAQAGAYVKEFRATGGAGNSSLWMQIKSDVTGKPIAVPNSETATTLGAAILAGIGIGLYKDFEEAIQETVTIKNRFEPKPQDVYDENYHMYRRLYENLK